MKILPSTLCEAGSSRRTHKSILALAVLSVSLGIGGAALADPKPKHAKAASAQMIANKYAGRMHVWKSCKGGVYFGSNWEAVAYCSKHRNAVGIGQWSTQGGKLCHKITWYSVKDGKLSTKPKEMKCDVHMLTDQDGQVWHSWESDTDWWQGFPREEHFTKGNKYKRQVRRLRKKFGV